MRKISRTINKVESTTNTVETSYSFSIKKKKLFWEKSIIKSRRIFEKKSREKKMKKHEYIILRFLVPRATLLPTCFYPPSSLSLFLHSSFSVSFLLNLSTGEARSELSEHFLSSLKETLFPNPN